MINIFCDTKNHLYGLSTKTCTCEAIHALKDIIIRMSISYFTKKYVKTSYITKQFIEGFIVNTTSITTIQLPGKSTNWQNSFSRFWEILQDFFTSVVKKQNKTKQTNKQIKIVLNCIKKWYSVLSIGKRKAWQVGTLQYRYKSTNHH